MNKFNQCRITALRFAMLLALVPGAVHAQKGSDSVAAILAQANDAVAKGADSARVEAWVRSAIKEQGAKVQIAPAPWDAYAQAEWRRSEREAPVAQDPRRPQEVPTGVLIGNIPGGDTAPEGKTDEPTKIHLLQTGPGPSGPDHDDPFRVGPSDAHQEQRGRAAASPPDQQGLDAARAAVVPKTIPSAGIAEKGAPSLHEP